MKRTLHNSADAPLRRQRDYRLYWSARTTSLSGSEVSRLAIPLTAATLLAASPMQMGLLTAATTAPQLLFGLPAGALADRLRRRRPVLVACELVAAATALSVPITWITGLLTVPWLIGVALVIGCCATLFKAVDFPHLLTLVPKEQRTEAMAGLNASYSIAMVTGPSLGGLLVQLLSAPLAVLAEALSFLASALLLRSIRTPERHTPVAAQGIGREVAQGLRIVLTHPVLRALLGAGVSHNFFASIYMAVYMLYALYELDLPGSVLGFLTACFGVGGLLGAAAVPRLAKRLSEERLLRYAVLLLPLDFFVVLLVDGPLAVKIAILGTAPLATGMTIVVFATCKNAVTARETPTEFLGRVQATSAFAVTGVLTLGGVAGGALGELLGLRPVLWICAAGALLSIPWIWFSPLRGANSPTPTSSADVTPAAPIDGAPATSAGIPSTSIPTDAPSGTEESSTPSMPR